MVYVRNCVGVRHFSTRHKTEGDETPVTYLIGELQRSKHCTATLFRGLNGEEREGNPVSEESEITRNILFVYLLTRIMRESRQTYERQEYVRNHFIDMCQG